MAGGMNEGSDMYVASGRHSAPPRSQSLVVTGVAGAAMVGLGALLLTAPDAPPTYVADVQLVADDCNILDPNCDGTVGNSAAAFLDVSDIFSARPLFGPGGLLIGDGVSATADCTGDTCNGGDGGIFFGNGGDGANGGTGGRAWFFGNGGKGGDGTVAQENLPATGGGTGGAGGFFEETAAPVEPGRTRCTSTMTGSLTPPRAAAAETPASASAAVVPVARVDPTIRPRRASSPRQKVPREAQAETAPHSAAAAALAVKAAPGDI